MARTIATNTTVDRAGLTEFLRPRHHVILLTPRNDGGWQGSISGEHPDWAEYREAMTKQGNALIRITPTRWGPVATGGFPAHLA